MSTPIDVGYAVLMKEGVVPGSNSPDADVMQKNLGLLLSFEGEVDGMPICLVGLYDGGGVRCRLDQLISLCPVAEDTVSDTVKDTLSKNYAAILSAALKEIYKLRDIIQALSDGTIADVVL